MNLVGGLDCGLYCGVKLDDGDPSLFVGWGPSGVAAFALDLEVGFKVTFSWRSAILPIYDGTERRSSQWDRPSMRFQGTAKLAGAGPRLTRARMARFAAAGSTFLLGLPHEAFPLISDHVGVTLSVPPGAMPLSDWTQIGQRVIVRSSDGETYAQGVIQAAADGVGEGTITLDDDPGVAGLQWGWVMPAMAIVLEPQQSFNRYQTAVEAWQINAVGAIFDFAPPMGSFDLGAVTGDPSLAGAIVQIHKQGLADFLFNLSPNPSASITEVSTITTVFFRNGVTTLADLKSLLASRDNFRLVGTYNPAATLSSGDSLTQAVSNANASGLMGSGATLTMYAGHPVWDRELVNAQTLSDSVQAQTEILQLDGVPYVFGHATYPNWGREVAFEHGTRAEWQWLKLFLATVRGAQRVFWLPTWRDDFTWVSHGPSAITVRADDESDLLAWYPAQRDRLQIMQSDGTITYAQISGTPVDHGDGTQTLTIDATLSATDVELVSWLEPCRFESDDFEVDFNAEGFALKTQARAHAVTDPDLAETE